MKAFIVDDEIIEIRNLETLITSQCPEVQIVGSAQSIDEAMLSLKNITIDLLFLDIEMPGKNGFHLFGYFNYQLPFHVIFVTAYSAYAIQAIKFSALDYILKPIQGIDLKMAINKLKGLEQAWDKEKRISILVNNMRQSDEQSMAIALSSLKETRFVVVNNIIFCEARNNYTIFHLTYGEKILVSKGLFEYDRLLSGKAFIRCHQSYLVNKIHIIKLVKKQKSMFLIVHGGLSIPVSRIKKRIIEDILGY